MDESIDNGTLSYSSSQYAEASNHVDQWFADEVAAAIEAGTIMVVRSTGAPVSGGSPNVEAGS